MKENKFMHLITLMKIIKYLRWYFEDVDLYNGIVDGRYTFKQITPHKFHVKIIKVPGMFGKFTTFKNLKFNVDIDRETLVQILDEFIILDKNDVLNFHNKLSTGEIKLLERFSEKYSKFNSEIPTFVV